MKKQLFALLLALFCAAFPFLGVQTPAALAADDVMAVRDELGVLTNGIFANAEINRMINKNYEQVQKEGYAELHIPMSLHHITRDDFSKNALDTADRLLKAGFKVYLVGGALRDLAAGVKGNDFDFTTDATLEQQREIFGEQFYAHENQSGVFGGVSYPDEDIDLATLWNVLSAYRGRKGIPPTPLDGHDSDSALFDSVRRDLTINALYYDMATGDIIDFHGGLHDLRDGVIDSVVEPELEFTPDGNVSASLRAFRFKARFNFNFSDRLDAAFRKNAVDYMKLLTPGTIGSYLRRMFRDGCCRRNFDTLTKYGVFGYLFPAVKDICGTDAYQKYAAGAMDFIDRQTETGMKVSTDLVMALLLRPALEKAGVKEVLDAQGTVYGWQDGEREAVEKILRSIAPEAFEEAA